VSAIVAGNSAASSPDISRGFTDNGHNLLGIALQASPGSGDVFSDQPLLAPLGNYGGPTQTMALLPGSPALDAGDPADQSLDQRGVPAQNGRRDIGAFESHGFTLTYVSGSNQSTLTNTAFAARLVVLVTAINPAEPVAGGVVTFAAPSSGASLAPSAGIATIAANGQASLTATANGVVGFYTVTASANGATGTAGFDLGNGSAVQLADALIAYITDLIATNQIGNGTGTSLINADLKNITGTTGIRLIDNFIATVEKDVAQGKISQDIGTTLIDDALVVRAGLTS
jgi:hypothetical protein